MNGQKRQAAFFVLMNYAGKLRILTYLSLILAAITGILALMPFVYIWKIIKEAIEAMPDFSQAVNIAHNGWMAVGYSLLFMLAYFLSLMCSHLAAFRVAGNMKKGLLHHIAKLPVGFADDMGSGKVRRIVMESTAVTETFLAHNLPDVVQAVITPFAMVVILFLFDWRFGLACLLPLVCAFAFMMQMAGPSMAEDMKRYQSALENMSNEAVEYVRGIPVVKTFGQTVFSFHRFKKSIDEYGKFCLHYTVECRKTMLMFELLVNSAFAFLICLTLFLTRGGAATQGILVNFLFYVIFTPIITTTMMRVMYVAENGMKIKDAITRVNSILEIEPLSEPKDKKIPAGVRVEMKDVTYCYGKEAKPAVSMYGTWEKKNG